MLNWSPDQVINRWKISVDLFSRLFLADGPGAERDSFLAARAGVAGRLARYNPFEFVTGTFFQHSAVCRFRKEKGLDNPRFGIRKGYFRILYCTWLIFILCLGQDGYRRCFIIFLTSNCFLSFLSLVLDFSTVCMEAKSKLKSHDEPVNHLRFLVQVSPSSFVST